MLVTPEPFRTACAIIFLERQAIAGRVLGTNAGCGLSTRGLWAGPAICNESEGTLQHGVQHGITIKSIMVIISIISISMK